jgi:hypothetical protein
MGCECKNVTPFTLAHLGSQMERAESNERDRTARMLAQCCAFWDTAIIPAKPPFSGSHPDGASTPLQDKAKRRAFPDGWRAPSHSLAGSAVRHCPQTAPIRPRRTAPRRGYSRVSRAVLQYAGNDAPLLRRETRRPSSAVRTRSATSRLRPTNPRTVTRPPRSCDAGPRV